MALVGTISGSNGTMVSAVTGSLIIADKDASNFPSKPGDAVLFVSGVVGGRGSLTGSVAVIGGDLVVSGAGYFLKELVMSGTGIITSVDTITLTDGAATIYVDPSSSIYFADAWTSESVSWPEPLGVMLSSTGSEWDAYYSLFGTASLLSAISASAGGATPPGGTNAQIQFNDSGSFGGDPGLTYDKNTNIITMVTGVAEEMRLTGNLLMSGTGVITSINELSLTGYEVGSIYIDPSSSIYFADAWTSESVSWPEPLGVRLSSTGSEWDGYYAIFGEKSLIGAISASASPTPPGGSNTYVQFNDSGSFGGNSELTYEKATSTLSVSGTTVGGTSIELGAGRTSSGTAFIDFHSSVSSDYDARILKDTGAGGNFSILNSGSGDISIATSQPTVGKITMGNRTEFPLGLSGSLTQLSDGTSYLIAGTNIGIASASNGAVTISNTMSPTAPGGSNTQVQFNDSGIFSGSSLFTFDKSTGAVTASYFSGNGGALTNLTASQLIVSGVATINGYLELLPVAVNIPTDVTASYVYTSGSTNDLYFTQRLPGTPYSNTVRLRWLEAVLATGQLHGGILSTVNGTTTFNVTSGSGFIVSQNATTGSDAYPTIVPVEWPTYVSESLQFVTSSQITYISVNSGGAIFQSITPPTITQYKDRIYLGRVLHQTGSVTNGVISSPAVTYGSTNNVLDFTRAFGPLKVSGHVLAASGSTLGLTKTAGDSYAEGRNYTADPNSPNIIISTNDPALVNCKVYREYTNSLGNPVIDTGVANAGYAVIDPTKYNNGGTLAAVNNNEWSNQRVFWFPRSVNRALFVYYGPAKYANFDDAIGGVATETFTEGDNTKGAAVFVGIITVKGNETSLTNTLQCRITPAGLHRGAGSGGGGGGSATAAGSNTYVQYNDNGVLGADAGFTYDFSTDTMTVGNTFLGDGGVLGTTGSSFTLVNTNATSINFGGAATSINVGSSGGSTHFAGNVTGSSFFASGSLTLNNNVTPALFTTAKITSVVGNNTIYSVPTASCDGAFFDYVAISGSNSRAGHIVAIRSGSSVNFNETTTTDFGSTSGVAFGFDVSGGNLLLTGSTTTADWTIKAIVRSI